MTDSFFYRGPTVQVSGQLVRDAQIFDDLLQREMARGIREMTLDMTNGPRYGPRQVLNDDQQAKLDCRQALADVLLELADEWGVTDLVVGDSDW